jgi:hypothetical protein
MSDFAHAVYNDTQNKFTPHECHGCVYGNGVVNRTGQLMYKAKGCYSMMLRWSDTFNELVRS